MERKVLGEGAYGCVHNPPIHCDSNTGLNIDYKDYVSKLMKTRDAQIELSEFVTLKTIDPDNKYHLGTPVICKPNLKEEGVGDDISKCNSIKLKDVNKTPDKYSLLLMKNGGPNLKVFCEKELTKNTRVDLFWLEVHNLFKGLLVFKRHGLVHNDIKPQNILINLDNMKMKYIDFGTMRKKNAVLKSSKEDNNNLGIFHWSYPFDCGFMNDMYYRMYKKNPRNMQHLLSQRIIMGKNTKPKIFLPINKPKAFDILFTYLNPENVIPSTSTRLAYMTSFFNGFDELVSSKSYAYVLNHITDSIDIFSLGFTLQFMANQFHLRGAISLSDFTKLSIFFHKMWDFNPSTRVVNLSALLVEYERILLELGVLSRLNSCFENHKVIHKAPPETVKEETSVSKHLSAKLESEAYQDPIKLTQTINSKSSRKKTKNKTKTVKSRRKHKATTL
jgi:serine/threonine protein kinase